MGGIAYTELELLIAGLVSSPSCVGLEVTVFDPDYDPDGVYARDVADTLAAGLAPLVHAGAGPGGAEEPASPVVMPLQRSAPPAELLARPAARRGGRAGNPRPSRRGMTCRNRTERNRP